MTRLREEDILDITLQLSEYDNQLLAKVGQSLAGIAAHALGKSQEEFRALQASAVIAVVPVSCGQGVINGFSQSVQKIIEFLGFTAFVTVNSDVGGLAEAVNKGAKVIFLADDDHFVAINMATSKVVDNGEATGKGYAAALDLMSGGLQGKEVLLIGAGPVGAGAAAFMTMRGAAVFVYDIDEQRVSNLRKMLPSVQVVQDFSKALGEHKLLFEATPVAALIGKEYLTVDTIISAPGIPLGLSQDGIAVVGDRLIHDVLEIGVATMLVAVLMD
jgi:pyrrolysine biosynthesis protein PylD